MFLKENIRGISIAHYGTLLKYIIKVAPVIKKKSRNEPYLLKDFYHYIHKLTSLCHKERIRKGTKTTKHFL